MDIKVERVGKRWFNCKHKSDDVEIMAEATFSNGFNRIYNRSLSAEAEYSVYDWIPARVWTITGKGSKRFRAQIEFALETFYKGLSQVSKATEPLSEAAAVQDFEMMGNKKTEELR